MRLCHFEDHAVGGLEPLTLTRPAFDLLCGLTPLSAKQRRFFAPAPAGVVVRPLLADLYRQQHPDTPVNDHAWLQGDLLALVNGRWLPPAGGAFDGDGPCVGLVGDEIAFAVVEPGRLKGASPEAVDDSLTEALDALPRRPAAGTMFRHLWEIVAHNGEAILDDCRDGGPPLPEPSALPALVGPRDGLRIDPSARIDPLVVVDTTAGPVVIEAGAVVTAFTRLEGPCVVGAGTHVLGGKVRGGSTLGPHCRIGGEVEASIVQGHSNKYHDGFLGHAYVGEWVNLGAGTSNSDLRNDYGEVRVMVGGQLVRTGMKKVGCFLGDHTKTGLGTLLNTGTSAGVFCNLLPGGLLPRYVPSFATCQGERLSDRADPEALFRTAGVAMGRRGETLTEAHEALYRALFVDCAADLRRAVRDAEVRALRRGA
jgi:UDP-N-acetylglucosamine diphosphorylase/glucosamine-1-phosphate N-acetyltransferase